MHARLATLALAGILLGGCVTAPYSLVTPGENSAGDLKFTAGSSWNAASAMMAPYARQDALVWTQDGPLLDRLLIIPGVPDGEALFRVPAKSAALPVFRADMLPNEIAELVESSIVKILGEGQVAVSTSNLRPTRFGEQRGAMFDISSELMDGPDYRGIAGGFVAGEKLYLIIYLGAEPYYFEKHRAEAETLLSSARL
jgi:hypothetical protein